MFRAVLCHPGPASCDLARHGFALGTRTPCAFAAVGDAREQTALMMLHHPQATHWRVVLVLATLQKVVGDGGVRGGGGGGECG
jgi:hypothetical protein